MRPAAALLVALGLLGPPPVPGEGAVVVDRVVAVVDEDPILLSDVERLVVLAGLEPVEGEDEQDLLRRALDRLIDQRLRFHEVDRHGFVPADPAELDARVEALEDRFGGAAELERRLAEVGLDRAGLRYLLGRQLRVDHYIEERLGPRVFVDLDDVRAYYEDELAPEMARQGSPLPPIDEVREVIRGIVRERRINREIVAWTAELRQAADVAVHLDREVQRELPPVVLRIDG